MTTRVSVPLFLLLAGVSFGPAPAAAESLIPSAPAATWSAATPTPIAQPLTEADFTALPHVAASRWTPPFVALSALAQDPPPQAPTPRALAYEYSDGYRTRARIHRYASFATLPLFVAQYVSGDRLYEGSGGGGARSTHGAVAAGVGALFGVNSVTGVWNLWEARRDPNNRKRRLLHGIVMLGCDAGFVATGMLAPDDDGGGSSGRSLHRNVAIASMGVASANFLLMLLTSR